MNIKDALKLHNGDEVLSKETEESIRVLDTNLITLGKNKEGKRLIEIKGVGESSGYKTWYHDEVK